MLLDEGPIGMWRGSFVSTLYETLSRTIVFISSHRYDRLLSTAFMSPALGYFVTLLAPYVLVRND